MSLDRQRNIPVQYDHQYEFVPCSFATDATGNLTALQTRYQGPVARLKPHVSARNQDPRYQALRYAGQKSRWRYVVRRALHPALREAESSEVDSSSSGEGTTCEKFTSSRLAASPATCSHWSDQLQSLFLNDCVGGPADSRSGPDRLDCLVWFQHLPTLSTHGEVAGLSARALVVIAVGRTNKDDRLAHQATSAYVDALTLLNRELSNPSLDNMVNNLTACLHLIAYGLYMNNTADFSAHVAGMTCVMLASGPDAFREGEMYRIFLACRQYLIYGALCSRTSSFLGGHQWLSIIPDEDKSAHDRLLDIMTQIPGIRSRFLTLQSSKPKDAGRSSGHKQLVDHLWHLQAVLVRWHDQYAPPILSSKPVSEFDFGGARASSLRHPPQQHHNFGNVAAAIALALYWACMIEVYNILSQSYEALGTSSRVSKAYLLPPTVAWTPLIPPHHQTRTMTPFAAAAYCRAQATTYAKAICSSVHYFTSNRPTVFAPVHIMAPLKMALRCFVLNLPASAEYLEWTHEMLGVLQSTGVGIVEWVMLDKGIY